MLNTSIAYRALTGIATSLLPVAAAAAGGKLARSVRGRQGVVARLEAWGRTGRDPSRPLLWIHAPSVGEGLQAEAVLRVLRSRHPDWQVAWTHYSPSSAALAVRQAANVTDYLPWDRRSGVRRALDALRPTALVFAKLDLWPELACQAAARRIPVGIVAATVSPVSGRLRWPVRTLLRPGYAAVRAAGAIAQPDADRLARLGTPSHHVVVLGDPRFDSVLDQIAAVPPDDPSLRFRRGPPVLVAGSTWPADEAVVLRALVEVRRAHPATRLIIAPHEPTAAHLTAVRATCRSLGLPDPVGLEAATDDAPLVLVDRVGLLARLYGSGAMAFVGGGFGTAGLHSVLEPAGWGLPVSFGPRWRSSREAGILLEAGAAAAVDRPDPARQLADWWGALVEDAGKRQRAGDAAREVLEAGRGAAARQAGLVERLMAADPY